MRQIAVIFGLVLVVLTAVVIVSLTDEPPHSVGSEHPQVPSMKIGGDGGARFEPVAGAALVFHVGSLLLAGAFIVLGVAPKNRTRRFWGALSAILVACIYVWWKMFASYVNFLETGEVVMVLGFPEPSAWMIYGVWGSGLLLSILYVIGFRRFIFPPEDEKAYQELVAEVRKTRESG